MVQLRRPLLTPRNGQPRRPAMRVPRRTLRAIVDSANSCMSEVSGKHDGVLKLRIRVRINRQDGTVRLHLLDSRTAVGRV